MTIAVWIAIGAGVVGLGILGWLPVVLLRHLRPLHHAATALERRAKEAHELQARLVDLQSRLADVTARMDDIRLRGHGG